jgi:hypothetical protein
MLCEYCEKEFYPNKSWQVFCEKACKDRFHLRQYHRKRDGWIDPNPPVEEPQQAPLRRI